MGRGRWEHKALALLAYPANLALGGVAAFLLALPLVTWLVGWVAVGRALHAWSVDDDDAVFTNTFRFARQVWRRVLPWSILATAITAVLVVNLVFLGTRDTPVAFLFGMATVPFAAAFLLLLLGLPVAVAAAPEGSLPDWLRTSAATVAARPVASLILLAIVVAFGLTMVLVPTLAPFFGLSVPVWLALVTYARERRG